MNNNEKFWVQEAIDKAQYLTTLDVCLVKIREEILKSQTEEFWGNQRRLLLELLLHEIPSLHYDRAALYGLDADLPF